MIKAELEEALIKSILVQQQQIKDYQYLSKVQRRMLEISCGLDADYERFYFSNVFAFHPSEMPGEIPDQESLAAALLSLGWNPRGRIYVDPCWHSFTREDPYKPNDIREQYEYEQLRKAVDNMKRRDRRRRGE